MDDAVRAGRGQVVRAARYRAGEPQWGAVRACDDLDIHAVLLVLLTVTAASLSENAVGIQLLDQAKKTYPTITKSWVDTGFKNAVIEHGASLGIDVEVVNRNPGVRGFHVVKGRWVVERSIGWIMLHRRLARDYETLPATSEAMIHVASIDNLTKRITDETTPNWRGTY
ncbi:DDE family transposase [Streptomyces sp. Ag109_O5-1]|nr:DDE family transposase [Streptomyces sp. Ag109_O5-1]